MENDLLIKHLRALAKGINSVEADNVQSRDMAAIPEDAIAAAKWVEEQFGLSGDVAAKTQINPNPPEAIPDTTLNAHDSSVVEGKPKHVRGDAVYLPELGIFTFSDHHVGDWRTQAKSHGVQYEHTFPQHKIDDYIWAIREEEILDLADKVKAFRKMSDMAKKIRAGKPVDERHEGTDARKDNFHGRDYKNWSDGERSRSSVCMSRCSGTRYLNGSLAEHQHYMSLTVCGPDGRTLVEINMTMDQLASMLVSNTLVPVTLNHYWSLSDDSVSLTERVYTPDSILDRMRQRLKDSMGNQETEFAALLKDLKGRVKPPGIVELREIIRTLEGIYASRRSNTAFIVEQAVEEGSQLTESAMARVLLAQACGGDLTDAVKSIANSFKAAALLTHDESKTVDVKPEEKP